MKKLYIILCMVPFFVFAFPFNHNHTGQGGSVSIDSEGYNSSEQMIGCIGDCAACHSLTPIEAQSILGQKFDVKKVLSIGIKNGYFEVEYETSEGKKEKINLFFSKDKACREVIHLNE